MSERLRNPAPWMDPSPAPPRTRRKRWGILDLLVAAAVLVAVWSRTPVGAVMDHSLVALIGGESDSLRPFTAYYDTGSGKAEALDALLAEVDALPRSVETEGAFPEPLRTAATSLLARRAPRRARSLLRDAVAKDPDATWGSLLDERYEGDAAATLEGLVITEEQRNRAIMRAVAAGLSDAERWEHHRAYLPMGDRLAGDRVVGQVLALGTVLDLTWPVKGAHPVTSGWGERDHPVLGKRKFHNGVDLGVPIGTRILSAQAGTVRTGEDRVSGRYVVVDHGHGVRTSYCHLDRFLVVDGEKVDAGTTLAFSGNTGRSTGPHLHFVVRIGKRTVDPERLRRAPTVDAAPEG